MNTRPLYMLIWQVRRLFQDLRAVSDELLEGSGINASHRAVLEFLQLQQPQTVSQMARDKSVSRQHIQTVVNELLALDLVATMKNPAHKRSPLIKMTPAGKELFQSIEKKESELLRKLESRVSDKNISITLRTLRTIDEYLQSDEQRTQ